MKVAFSNRSVRQYGKLSAVVQARFDKQLGFLLSNLRHPSLRANKYDEAANIWQARVNDNYRFYFQIHGDTHAYQPVVKFFVVEMRGTGIVRVAL